MIEQCDFVYVVSEMNGSEYVSYIWVYKGNTCIREFEYTDDDNLDFAYDYVGKERQ